MPQKKRDLAVAERFGRNLFRIRKREDLSQDRLAELASVHRTYIGMMENGHRACGIAVLVKLAAAMSVPPGELLDGIDWIPGPDPHGTFTFGGDGLRRAIVKSRVSNPQGDE
jgi:transcriptional regulator with XRE-family HTH domain